MNVNTTIGLLGSGQLSRMSAMAASELGLNIHVICNDKHKSPASFVAGKTTHCELNDLECILQFASECDYITLENEFIDQKILNAIEKKHPHKLFPTAESFSLIGDKLTEKQTFQAAGIRVAPFQKVESTGDIKKFILQHNYPVVLKTIKGGYDGYGNFTIKTEADIITAFKKLQGELIVEKFIPYLKEVAITAAQNSTQIVYYPIVETHQENHICHFVTAPAEISESAQTQIYDFTKKALQTIKSRGLFAFEFFVTKEDEVYLNESAPRPHNSAHYTMMACETSQFTNHIRSVLDLPLGSTKMKYPFCVMLNLLGTADQIAELKPKSEFLKNTNSELHLYGKIYSKIGRKMGHYILCGDNQDQLLAEAKRLKEIYTL